MARIFYKELFTPFKTVALLLCIGGCFFAATGVQWGEGIEIATP
jgi:hypothetical protein